jgi:signal transduction histidine kinase
MSDASPRLPLVLLLLIAACILAGGVALSKREHTHRIPQERAPLTHFASDLTRELRRLEDLHLSHLDHLTRNVKLENTPRAQKDCEGIVGIAECSFLFREPSRDEVHVRMSHVPPGNFPRPTFNSPSPNRIDFTPLDRSRFFENAMTSAGWLDEPGRPLLYWRLHSDYQVVLLTIDAAEVRAAMTKWLREWLPAHPAPAGIEEGRMELSTPDGATLVGRGNVNKQNDLEPPNWSHPLPTRYGTWNLASWDKLEMRVTHHTPTLVIAAALSVIVALLGVLVFVQQRRAHRLAAQRVSFVNRVSHELRTPLTNMLLNLDLVEDSLGDSSTSRDCSSRLALVREEAGRLARLIENVLTFSRREQGTLKIHARECRPREVVETIVKQFAPAFARREIALTREHEGADDPCVLDADALAQITANLLSNVEKYAPGVATRVLTAQHNGTFALTVADEGPGIAAGERERIFNPFARVDDRVTAGVTGTGLGLSIARELAERMGGRLELARSGRENGATFVLHIPVSKSERRNPNDE